MNHTNEIAIKRSSSDPLFVVITHTLYDFVGLEFWNIQATLALLA